MLEELDILFRVTIAQCMKAPRPYLCAILTDGHMKLKKNLIERSGLSVIGSALDIIREGGGI
jgi:hypothetical protein